MQVAVYSLYLNRAAALLTALCALCALLYGVFLLQAVAHTAHRAQAVKDVAALKAELASLEATYLAQTRGITPERADALGFVAPVHVARVYAGAAGTLSLLNTR